ncbi:MAG: carbohydrate ABC transporter permease [Lachnospiraceae bacterium]
MIGVLVFFILPFLDVVRRSVSNTSGTRYVGARNYMNVAENEAFRLSVQNTARFLLISVPLLFLVSLLLAYYINTQIVRNGLVKAVFLFPMILPVSTTTLFCRILFDNAGILNGAFQKLGMDTLRLMDTGSVFWVLVALYFWKNIGFCVVLWSAAMEAIPKEIFEAAG